MFWKNMNIENGELPEDVERMRRFSNVLAVLAEDVFRHSVDLGFICSHDGTGMRINERQEGVDVCVELTGHTEDEPVIEIVKSEINAYAGWYGVRDRMSEPKRRDYPLREEIKAAKKLGRNPIIALELESFAVFHFERKG